MTKINGKKDPAAVALGNKRWAKLSQLPADELREHMRRVSAARKLTRKRRLEISALGVAARKKKAASKKSRRKAKPRKG